MSTAITCCARRKRKKNFTSSQFFNFSFILRSWAMCSSLFSSCFCCAESCSFVGCLHAHNFLRPPALTTHIFFLYSASVFVFLFSSSGFVGPCSSMAAFFCMKIGPHPFFLCFCFLGSRHRVLRFQISDRLWAFVNQGQIILLQSTMLMDEGMDDAFDRKIILRQFVCVVPQEALQSCLRPGPIDLVTFLFCSLFLLCI